MRDESYTIQQLATHARVSIATIRKYQDKGLVDRRDGTDCSPIYTNRHLRQILWVIKQRESNVTLDVMRDMPRYNGHVVKLQG
jgi:DNA-binding transcriptional MerR regulator